MRTLLGESISNNKSLDDHILMSNVTETPTLMIGPDLSHSKKSGGALLNRSVAFGHNSTKNIAEKEMTLSVDQMQTIMQYHKNYGGLKVLSQS